MTDPVDILTTSQRAVVDSLLDVLIPGGDGMPSARDAATSARWLPTALDLRPDLRPALETFLDAAARQLADGVEAADALRRIAIDSPDLFAAVTGLLAGAYYLDPGVRDSLGYPGQEERVLGDDTDSYLDLLERVVDRGPVYREPATTHEGGIR